MKKITVLLFALILPLLFSNCTTRMVDFTIISTKNIDLAKGATFVRGKNRVEGEDMIHWIIYIPIGKPNIKEAVDEAIESTPGCIALLDGVLYSRFWWIPFIYGQQYYLVEGTPLIDPSLAFNEIDDYSKIIMDRKGNVIKTVKITPEEFQLKKKKFSNKFDLAKFVENSKPVTN
ncbi:MAG: hypothetical protein FVQ77_12825 [Cytophagales bacterium]|nr:hypothetical protein [Cytophagales bacterium]